MIFGQSHPRQWVDVSSSTYQRSVDQFVNPTHSSGWIVQAQPTGAPPDPLSNATQAASGSFKARHERSTHCRGWDCAKALRRRGHPFPVGTTTVNCSATGGGSSASCSFTVTVFGLCLQDETNPGNFV